MGAISILLVGGTTALCYVVARELVALYAFNWWAGRYESLPLPLDEPTLMLDRQMEPKPWYVRLDSWMEFHGV